MADFHLPEHEVHAVADEAEELVKYQWSKRKCKVRKAVKKYSEAVDSPEEKSGKDA